MRRQPSVIHLDIIDGTHAVVPHVQRRENSVGSIGQDSGKGESMPRNSTSSNETPDETHRRFSVHSSMIQKGHAHRKRSDQPATPALVLSEYKSIDDGL